VSEYPPIRVNILGPLECWVGETRIQLNGLLQRRILVSLLLDSGKVLSVSRLVDACWDESPPATASHQVRKTVASLRKLIPGGHEVIVTDGPGYRAVIRPDRLDLATFLDLLHGATNAIEAGLPNDAATRLQAALDLWHGPVLAGDGGPVIDAAAVSLEERRLAALEQLIDLRLARGEASALVGDLREYITAHPLREILRRQLMLALYRSGRQAEALDEYQRVRTLLADELGIDPSSQLNTLNEQILRMDPSLAGPESQTGLSAQDAAPEPVAEEPTCTLPYDLPDFTGRNQELEALLGYIESDKDRGIRVAAIDGMGGVGKTSLAVRAAYIAADRFPDGQLFVDLAGFTVHQKPLRSAAIVEELLRMLRIPIARAAGDTAACLALWRSTLAHSRLLLVFDNASDAAQVKPLLPVNSDSLVIITSRKRLVDLDGASWMTLGAMTSEDGMAMAVNVLSEARAAAEPEALAELTELCGRLPLALRIALAKLANRPRWSVDYLVERMSDESRRLDELQSGERQVELMLRLSYEGLDESSRAAFRLLGTHPGREIDAYSAAALLGTTPEEAETVMEGLLDTHMLQQHEVGYYTFHELVRSFARLLVSRNEASSDGQVNGYSEALGRLLDYFLATTSHACDLVFPGRAKLQPGLPGPAVRLPPLSAPDEARKWLRRQQPSLLAAVKLAHQQDLHRYAAYLARNVIFQLSASGQFDEFHELAEIAVASSRTGKDPALLRLSLSNLSVARWELGNFSEGIEAAQESLDLAIALNNRQGAAKAKGVLGLLKSTIGRYEEALPLLLDSVALKHELGASRAEAESLVNLSTLYEQRGDYAAAAQAAVRAVALNRQLGIRENEVIALMDLSIAYLRHEKVEQADRHLAAARALLDDFMPAGDAALVFALSAAAAHRLSRPEHTAEFASRALDLNSISRTPIRKAAVHNVIGCLRYAEHDHAEARDLHETAYTIAAAVGYRIEEARALRGAAEAQCALGAAEAGADLRRRADTLFESLGIPARARPLHVSSAAGGPGPSFP
jgi:DNA-binding SARP family transcriptional activator